VLAFVIIAWEVLPRAGVINPLFIPPFSRVASALCSMIVNGQLPTHTLISLRRAMTGLLAGLIFGLPLGFLLGGWFPRTQEAVEPLMALFAQANPLILFHVVMLFLGVGEMTKTFIIGWLCLWPITFSTITGVKAADPLLLKTARSFGLGRLALFLRVTLPASAPSIFTGLRLSAGYAFIMLVAAEMMGASSGLGWLVIQFQESYDATHIFAAALVITLLAVGTDSLLKLLGGRFLLPAGSAAEDYVRLTGGKGEKLPAPSGT